MSRHAPRLLPPAPTGPEWPQTRLFFGLMLAAALACLIIQLALDPGETNLWSTVLAAGSASATFVYLWVSGSTRSHPVSALALLGLTVTSSFAALCYQSFGGTVFTQYLRWPVATFGVLALVQGTALLAHWVYRHLAAPQQAAASLRTHVMRPLGLMTVPRPLALWLMAPIGLYAMAKGGEVGTGDAAGKFVQAFSFLSYAPFLIPVYLRQLGEAYGHRRTQLTLVAGYTLVMVGMAMGLNARQFMVIGPVQVALMALVYGWSSPAPLPRHVWLKLFAAGTVMALGLTLLSDLTLAMLVVRDKRDKLDRWALVQETVDTLRDRAKLAQLQDEHLADFDLKLYDETYLRNPVVSRFSEAKFHDNTIYPAMTLNDDERRELWQITGLQCLGIVPQNVLDFLEIKVRKDDYAFSLGDTYRYLSEGPEGTLGGYATGSVWAHLIGLIGLPWLPVVLMLMFVPTFVVLDAASEAGARLFISPPMVCNFWFLFIYGLAGESLVWKVGFYLRDMPQRLLLYAGLFALVRAALGLFGATGHLASAQRTAA